MKAQTETDIKLLKENMVRHAALAQEAERAKLPRVAERHWQSFQHYRELYIDAVETRQQEEK